MHEPTHSSAQLWGALRQLTSARIALGRAGTSLPTQAQLDFQFAHAQARDAVHLAFDSEGLSEQLKALDRPCLTLHSAANDRHHYLQRPDLGRRLDEDSARRLREQASRQTRPPEVVFVIADGLSALAVHRHALPFLQRFTAHADVTEWREAPIVLVHQGRVAVADEVAALLGARMSVMLIGERPGLSSPDSLGIYFTYAPEVGLTDAYRNCISNVRLEGLSYGMAAHRLLYLMQEASRRQLSGVNLKDDAELLELEGDTAQSAAGNFLLPNH